MSAWFITRLVEILGSPLLVVYFLLRGLKQPKYFERFGERLGRLPRAYRQTAPGAVWLHAVSVGEVLSSMELLRRLRAAFPLAPLFVSTTTLAGRAVADEKLAGLADGVFYAPIDYCFAVRRVLRALRPRAVVVLETEIWPILYHETKRSGAALLVVNGRISDRAAPRYRRLRWFFRQVLDCPDAILAQSEVSRQRYLELGAPPGRVRLGGNLKYDFSPRGAGPPEAVAELLRAAGPGELWIAASTMPPAEPGDPDEDEAVLSAFQDQMAWRPRLRLVLAPRKPERFDIAAQMLRRAGVPFVRRSGGEAVDGWRVLLLDSIGELSSLFPFADVVFMGGTLARRGGHNILEPAFCSRPVIVGPHMENFAEIAAKFRQAGAVEEIAGAAELAGAVESLLADAGKRAAIGARARELAEAERGATARAVEEIEREYWRALPRRRPPLAPVLWPLTQLWTLGAAVNRARPRRRLATPVVSVGGLTMGGVGKSPVVLWLASRFHEAGLDPAILMRGYRRLRPERSTVLASGERAPVSCTGDEAQLFLRAGVAPLGIGADRVLSGRRVEERFHPDVFLLDDGFQHHRLERDADIVLLDALDPFSGGCVFPSGRLREPVAALRRADIILVTRVERGARIDGIEAEVRRWNPHAPIFTSRVVPVAWKPGPPPAGAGAFCGLGNPASFWQTLQSMGIDPAFRRAFPDHHRYRAGELEQMAARAPALLTTEKDLANLPEEWRERVFWLEIAVEIDQAESFFAAIERRLSKSGRNCLQ